MKTCCEELIPEDVDDLDEETVLYRISVNVRKYTVGEASRPLPGVRSVIYHNILRDSRVQSNFMHCRHR